MVKWLKLRLEESRHFFVSWTNVVVVVVVYRKSQFLAIDRIESILFFCIRQKNLKKIKRLIGSLFLRFGFRRTNSYLKKQQQKRKYRMMYKMLGIEKERRHRYFVTIATTSGDKAGKSSPRRRRSWVLTFLVLFVWKMIFKFLFDVYQIINDFFYENENTKFNPKCSFVLWKLFA